MTTQRSTPPGADLHLGGDAWAHPSLEPNLAPVGELHPYPGNPRRGDQSAITRSIRELGLYRPIVVQRSTGHVLAGNHTLRGLIDLGAVRVPVTWVDVDDTRAAAIVARDNRTSQLGGYDDGDLLALLTTDENVLALSGYAEDDLAHSTPANRPHIIRVSLRSYQLLEDYLRQRHAVSAPTYGVRRPAGGTSVHAVDGASWCYPEMLAPEGTSVHAVDTVGTSVHAAIAAVDRLLLNPPTTTEESP